MAIAFVRLGGTVTLKGVATDSFSVTVPAAGHAAGNVVVFAAGWATNSVPGDSSYAVSDSKGNTYTSIHLGVGITGPLVTWASLWASKLTAALVSGDTITLTRNPGTAFVTDIQRYGAIAAEYSGASITEDVASASTDNANTATPSVGPITPPSARTLLLGVVGIQGPSGDTFTQDTDTVGGASWVSTNVVGTTGGSATTNWTTRLAHKITVSSAAQTFNPLLGTARSETITLAALQENLGANTYTKAGFAKENG